MFGFSWLYTGIAAGVMLIAVAGYAGIKGYQFGADRERVKCEVRVNAIKSQIDEANAKIRALNEKWRADFDKIEAERDAEARKAEEAEVLANSAIGAYEYEISQRSDKCLLNGDDIKRLH